jgi:hypothetical protein
LTPYYCEATRLKPVDPAFVFGILLVSPIVLGGGTKGAAARRSRQYPECPEGKQIPSCSGSEQDGADPVNQHLFSTSVMFRSSASV